MPQTSPRLDVHVIRLVFVAALLAPGCRRPPEATHNTQATSPAITPASTPEAKAPLPALVAPERRPQGRVVNLLYTSNADGEVEPCG